MSSARFPTVISLAAGKHQLPLIRAAQAQGFKVVAIDRDAAAMGMQCADVALELSTHDAPGIIRALHELAPLFEFKGLLHRTSGKALESAALVCAEFGLLGLSPIAARISTEKSALREFCGNNGIPMPRGHKCAGEGDLPFGMPVIVKPDFPTVGKRDVRRISDEKQLPAAMQAAAASSFNKMVEIEQYIDGIDVSCLFHLSNRRARLIATYDELIGVAENGTLLPFGISMPSSHDAPSCRASYQRIIDDFAAALPGVDALMIVSLRVDRNGRPFVIELHADLGGDRIAEELFPRAMPELQFFDLAVRLATGAKLPELGTCQGSHMLLYGNSEEEACEESQGNAVLSAETFDENLEHLANLVLQSLQAVALPPRQITNWARALSGSN